MLLNEGVVAVLIILAVIMLVLLMMGYPMMVPLAVGTLFMMFTGLTFFGPDQAITWMVNGVGSWVLAAVPMFIFAADILTEWKAVWSKYRSDGYLSIDGSNVILSREGLLRVDGLLPAFFEAEHQGIRYT